MNRYLVISAAREERTGEDLAFFDSTEADSPEAALEEFRGLRDYAKPIDVISVDDLLALATQLMSATREELQQERKALLDVTERWKCCDIWTDRDCECEGCGASYKEEVSDAR